MNNQKIILEKFKKNGFKLTPQRLAIIKSLLGDTSHPGVSEVFKRLRIEYPSLSMTTVYNTMEMLQKIGAIQELILERNRRRYDPDTSIHDHVICVKCKRVDDIPTKKRLVIEKIDGYNILGVSNQYYGVCSQCQFD